MSVKKKFVPPNKIFLTDYQKEFIKENFFKMTNEEIADELGLSKTYMRTYAYSIGLRRSTVFNWSKEQVQFLLDHYKFIGNIELAKMMNEKFPGQKVMNKGRISKKLDLLGIKRTQSEENLIRERNRIFGCWGPPVKRSPKKPKKEFYISINAKTRILVQPGQSVENLRNKYAYLNL